MMTALLSGPPGGSALATRCDHVLAVRYGSVFRSPISSMSQRSIIA
jgi:hypothetical protein